jgi:4-diphosphocytidyl-2-C-methyl-D-erythritol kinase
MAITLGADVPFFLRSSPAWVSGIGEKIQELEKIPSFALLLANPGISLSTPRVFACFDKRDSALTRWESGSTMRAVFEFQERPRDEALLRLLQNDLEPAALDLCPALAELRSALMAAGAMAVAMSGSGATLYGVFEDVAAARRARQCEELDAACGTSGWSRVVSTLPSRS